MSIKEHVETWQLLVREGERRETWQLLEVSSPPHHHRTMYSHVRVMNAGRLSRRLKCVHRSTFDLWGLSLHKP